MASTRLLRAILITLAITLSALHAHLTAHALSARECAATLDGGPRRGRTPKARRGCASDGICGPFPRPDPSHTFAARLSPQCSALFETYRSPASRAGLANILPKRFSHACVFQRSTPNVRRWPLVIASELLGSPPFVACTVPKGGSTNLRVLLHIAATYPTLPSNNHNLQYGNAHKFSYPGLWHYRLRERRPANATTAGLQPGPQAAAAQPSRRLAGNPMLWHPQYDPAPPQSSRGPAVPAARALGRAVNASSEHPLSPPRLPPGVPSIAFSRNPYIRLVSGYRDKMTPYEAGGGDEYTRKAVNRQLGRPEMRLWPDNPTGFRQFVYELYGRGVAGGDRHFQPAMAGCSTPAGLEFDFYLRLEEMAQWFPCLMDGLALRNLTERGWASTSKGQMYVGTNAEEVFVVTVKDEGEAPEWDPVAGAATVGERGVHWDLVKGDLCWWTPKGVPCRDFYANFTTPDGSVVPGPDAEGLQELRGGEQGAGRQADKHDTGSEALWKSYYDQATADLAFLMYRVDFDAFGYERVVLDDAA